MREVEAESRLCLEIHGRADAVAVEYDRRFGVVHFDLVEILLPRVVVHRRSESMSMKVPMYGAPDVEHVVKSHQRKRLQQRRSEPCVLPTCHAFKRPNGDRACPGQYSASNAAPA